MIVRRLIIPLLFSSTCTAALTPRREHEDLLSQQAAITGDPVEGKELKYFHDSGIGQGYDARFAKQRLDHEEETKARKKLVQAFLGTSRSLRLDAWLMHSGLLGWWWNQQTLPWCGATTDFHVFEIDMHFLAMYHNMTVFQSRQDTQYLLDINPAYHNREQTDKVNAVDARWIDTQTGLYVNIFAARYNLTHPDGEGVLSWKDGYEVKDTYILPLRNTWFEDAPVKIPYRYRQLLVAEVGEDALTRTEYDDYRFDAEEMMWIEK